MKISKKITKTLLKLNFTQNLIAYILFLYIKFIHITSKWEKINTDFLHSLWREKKPYLVASWHGRIMLLFPVGWEGGRKNKVNAIFSAHRDGKLVGKLLKIMGVNPIFGSSTRGGVSASKATIKALKNGEAVGITPDGPKGPRMKAKKSLIFFAKKTGVPIVPIMLSSQKCKIINSWDKFMIPSPFTKGVFIVGKEIYVPKNATEEEMEQLNTKLEKELNRISKKADKMVGIEPILPKDEI